jgi:DNA-binding PucR family transcriptional regulator
VADISERTYRHRNTVRKRLQLLQDMTGLNLSLPRDVTTLSLAFDVYRERGR